MSNDADSFYLKVDLAYQLQPAEGIRDKFIDAWRSAMGMDLYEMGSCPETFIKLTTLVESPEHPLERRKMAARFLTEIATLNPEPGQLRTVRSAIGTMGETPQLAKMSARYLARLES